MTDTVCDWNVYKTPSNKTLRNRRAFYGLQRKNKEPVQQWLKRIRSCIWRCEFPSIIEFLLIDKFVCGLNNTELKTIQSVHTWTLKRLVEIFSIRSIEIESIEPNYRVPPDDYIIPNQILTEYLIKSEPEEEHGSPTDPFSELADETDVFVKIESNSVEEQLPIVGELEIDITTESPTNQEILIDHIKSECDYECAIDDAITSAVVFTADNHSSTPSNVTHTIKKQYSCDICDKTFNRAPNLSKHRKVVHRAILSHACEQCGRRFAFAEDLQTHMIYHTGERRICDLCNKSFSCSSTLRKHKKAVHQKLREFSCEQCTKQFYSGYELKRHTLLHKGEKPHDCRQCGKVFTQSYDLVRHTQTVHQKIRSFVCQSCDKNFIRLAALKRHYNNVHSS